MNRIPDNIVEQMEAEYRKALAVGCREALDDRSYYHAVATACAWWTVHTWRPRLMEDDGKWGVSTHRHRFLRRFEAFRELSESSGEYQALGATLGAALARGQELWLKETGDMPFYPAFRNAGS